MAEKFTPLQEDEQDQKRVSMTGRTSIRTMDQILDESDAKYKGRIRIWPGLCLLMVVITTAIALICFFGIQSRDDMKLRAKISLANEKNARSIRDGSDGKTGEFENVGNDFGKTTKITKEDLEAQEDVEELIDEDGVVGNPKEYPPQACKLPNYVVKNNTIHAVGKDGTSIPLEIKGVNWFGMETSHGIPYGLWDNEVNGSTLYEISAFLARNKFNSVRLPISIVNVLNNIKPNLKIVNTKTNRAMDLSNYISVLQSVVKGLAFRKISVMISIHTLTTRGSDKYWYNDDISVADVKKAYSILAKALCNDEYWNVIGLDLKNEPHGGTWGDGTETDWKLGATDLGNHMLAECPQWMAFIEGLNRYHSVKPMPYADWWGGGLQSALSDPIILDEPNKIVFAPHYYNPSVYPQKYMVNGGERSPSGTGALVGYTELSDEALKANVNYTMMQAFGYLNKENLGAIVLGEFGGIYAYDLHPNRTSQRVCNYTMEVLLEQNMGGGYMWSLNPESAYEFNPSDSLGSFQEGLLARNWLDVNMAYIRALRKLDDLPYLKKFPCLEED